MITPEQKYALVLYVKELMAQLDEVASLKRQGYTARISFGLFQEMCSILKELEPNLQDEYVRILVSLAGRSSSSTRTVYTEDYEKNVVLSKKKFIDGIRRDLKVAAND